MKLFLPSKKQQSGFTILFAVIVSALVLSIGLSIANITLKQIKISSLGRESQIAFYGADSGSECVLYYDLIEEAFATSSNSNISALPPTISCFNEDAAVIFDPSDPNQANTYAATSTIVFSGTSGICAKIQIGKSDTDMDGFSDKTSILSRGYNVCTNSGRQLERGIRIRY
jgi:Tfp pilus assembly protein PilX